MSLSSRSVVAIKSVMVSMNFLVWLSTKSLLLQPRAFKSISSSVDFRGFTIVIAKGLSGEDSRRVRSRRAPVKVFFTPILLELNNSTSEEARFVDETSVTSGISENIR